MHEYVLAASTTARLPDLVVIALMLAVMVAIGIYCARKTRSAEGYFLANRSMKGWVVGFSLMATIISSMTFLGMPGVTYDKDWRFMPAHTLYILPAILGYVIFMPFFRRGHVVSAYEYLERRFGTWARLYGAVAFIMTHLFRMGIILYAVSIPFHQMSGLPLGSVIVILGILVAIYTIAGGLEAVIYTDVLQGISLIIGGLICTPIVINLLPGGFSQLFETAIADGKFGVSSTEFTFDKPSMWSIILTYQFIFLQLLCTDQNTVQRYLAMKSEKEARSGFILSTVLTIPVWLYFAFIGTALYVFYKQFPDELPQGVSAESVFPHFILTQVPAGFGGFVIAGLLAAAMSTLDSSINASAATVTTDFYRRFRPNAGDERHYLRVGRIASLFFAAMMIGVAIIIHYNRSDTLMELQTVMYPIVTAGLTSVFLLGFFTVRAQGQAVMIATAATLVGIIVWVLLDTEAGRELFPTLAGLLPNKLWIGVIPYVFLLVAGYTLSFTLREERDLKNLTVWTKAPTEARG